MRTFLLICNVFCVFASDQEQNGDSPFMVNDDNIFQDKTLDIVLFPDDATEGDSEIQSEFSGDISSNDGTKSTETTATTTTTTTITTSATTTTTITTTKTTAATITATTTTTTTASTTSEFPKSETQSELSLNDDVEIGLDDSDNPDNPDLASDDSEENVLVKDNTGSDGGPIDYIYDLLEPDQHTDNSHKNSSSEEPLYVIIDTDQNNSVSENQENQDLDKVSGSESQEPSEGDPQVDTANDSVQLIAIIVGVVIVLLIIATSIFMIRRKRASSHTATYNITTVEQATRKPREAHI